MSVTFASDRTFRTAIAAGEILIVTAAPAGVVLKLSRMVRADFLPLVNFYLLVKLRDENLVTMDTKFFFVFLFFVRNQFQLQLLIHIL